MHRSVKRTPTGPTGPTRPTRPTRLAAVLVLALATLSGCGEDPYARGVPYRSERYSSQNGRYRTTGTSENTWAPFSNGHSEQTDYDDGNGNGMTYSRNSNRSQFP